MFILPQFQFFKWKITSSAVAVQAVIYDSYFNYTSLLINAESTSTGSQNSTFIDSSTNNYNITVNGTPTQTSLTPYAPNSWGVNFNGTTDYLSIPASSNLSLSTNSDFTIEGWINPTSGVDKGIFAINGGASVGINILIGNTGFYRVYIGTGGSNIVNSTSAVVYNKWTHLAVVRRSGILSMYTDGVFSVSAAYAVNCGDSSSTASVGAAFGNARFFPGTISNFRIVKDQALYTGNFTPSLSALTKTTVGATGNVVASLTGTVSLLTCQSNRFVDNGSVGVTITPTGTPKVNSFMPFLSAATYSPSTHGGSVYFDGSSYLTSTAPSLSGNYTLECWFYKTGAGAAGSTILHANAGTGNGTAIWINTSNQLVIDNGVNSQTAFTTFTIANNQWYHLAVVRSGTTTTAYLNGAVAGSNTYSPLANNKLTVGRHPTSSSFAFVGYVSDVRLVNESTVYTTTFTPPTAPLSAVAGTSLLLKANNGAVYDATNKNLITITGSASASTTVAKFGSKSIFFNGTNSYITMPETDTLILSSGVPFTIEGWLYPTINTPSYKIVLSKRTAVAQAVNYSVYLASTNGGISFQSGSVATQTNTALTLSAWNHFAVTYDGTNLSIYKDGIRITGPTAFSITNTVGSPLYLGYDVNTSSNYYQGYMDDIRITKGINRYAGLSSFTIPTSAFPTQ